MDNDGELVWRKSSRSSSGACVAVATGSGDLTHVRDSKDPAGPMLTFHSEAFRDFIASIKDAGPSQRS